MSTIWSRIDGPNGPSLSVIFSDGEVVPISKEHASFKEISKKLVDEAPEAEIRALINPVKAIAARFERLSERVTTDGTNLFMDGDVMHDSLSEHILKLRRLEAEGNAEISWKPFVNFLEKLAQNPSKESRESLFDFITHWGLTIRNDGDVIAYKGIKDDFGSVQRGPGIVNNVRIKHGSLDNTPGNLVEIERSYVEANRDLACAQGLHVTTIDYAAGWGPRVVAVAFNPRDMVSVPRREVSKARVCRYEVLVEVKSPPRERTGSVHSTLAPVWNPENEIDKKLLKKLKKAHKAGNFVEIQYKGKTYTAKPRTFEDAIVRVALNDGKSYRSFYLNKIQKVSKVQAEKGIDFEHLKQLQNSLFQDKNFLKIEYKGETYTAKPTFIGGGLVKVELAENAGYRTFHLKEVQGVSKLKKNKKAKKEQSASKKALILTEAIQAGDKVQLTLIHKDKKIFVKPRRVIDGVVGVTLPLKNNTFKKIALSDIKHVNHY